MVYRRIELPEHMFTRKPEPVGRPFSTAMLSLGLQVKVMEITLRRLGHPFIIVQLCRYIITCCVTYAV